MSVLTDHGDKCSSKSIQTKLGSLIDKVGKDTEVSWKQWVSSEDPAKQTRKVFSTKTGSMSELVQNLTEEVEFLANHLHVALWQHTQFQYVKNNLPQGWVTMVLGFGENYTCTQQDEVQSAHWHHEQATVHPIVTYYWCPHNGCNKLVTESMVFLSNDRKHDHHAVDFFVSVVNSHLQGNRKLELIKEVHFTDGCAAQYKSKWAFYSLSQTKNKSGFEIERAFFGSRHGKGPSDGESAVIKSRAAAAVKSHMADITNAKEMFKFCSDNLTRSPAYEDDGSCKSHFLRTFFWVPDGAVNRENGPAEVSTVPGTRLLHSVKAIDGIIGTRKLSCFCPSCTGAGTQDCENSLYVEPWFEKRLKVKYLETEPDGDSENSPCILLVI